MRCRFWTWDSRTLVPLRLWGGSAVLRGPHDYLDPAAHGGGEIDERIEGEAGDAAPQQVVDARLRDPAVARGLRLSPALGADDLFNLAHQLASSPQILGLGAALGERLPNIAELFAPHLPHDS